MTDEATEKSDLAGALRAPFIGRTIPVAIAILMSYARNCRLDADARHLRVDGLYALRQPALQHDHPERQRPSVRSPLRCSLLSARKKVLTVGAALACLAAVSIVALAPISTLFSCSEPSSSSSSCCSTRRSGSMRRNCSRREFAPSGGPHSGNGIGGRPFVPTISGMLFDSYGMIGVFGLLRNVCGLRILHPAWPGNLRRSMEDLSLPAEADQPKAAQQGQSSRSSERELPSSA